MKIIPKPFLLNNLKEFGTCQHKKNFLNKKLVNFMAHCSYTTQLDTRPEHQPKTYLLIARVYHTNQLQKTTGYILQ